MNIIEAQIKLSDVALDCEDANYHAEAGVIWDRIIPDLDTITTPTCIWVSGVDEVIKLEVTP